MKGFLQIACFALLVACAVTSDADDNDTCGIYADSLAHPVDCNKYYNLRLHTCPEGLYFNAQTKQCDLPQNTKCGQATTTVEVPTEDGEWSTTPIVSSSTISTTPTTTPRPSSTTPSTVTPSTETTEDWTSTDNTTPSTVTTIPSTSTTGNPTSSTSGSTTTTGTTEAPTQNGCPAVDDLANRVRFPHETNCQLYYLCVNGTRVLYSCTSNHFSPIKKGCRPANEAGCDQCPETPVEGEVVRLPHESICAYYYRCEGTEQIIYRCPDDQQFSRVERGCVSEEEARCTLEDLAVPVPLY